jgi:hypothetical protein
MARCSGLGIWGAKSFSRESDDSVDSSPLELVVVYFFIAAGHPNTRKFPIFGLVPNARRCGQEGVPSGRRTPLAGNTFSISTAYLTAK